MTAAAGFRVIVPSRSIPAPALAGLRPGVLLELGFDDATPNSARDIRSWAHDYAASKVDIIDNRAKGVVCYDPGYTFVEKLQTVSTKFRRQQESGEAPVEFMRHYFDVYALLRFRPSFRIRSTRQRDSVKATIPTSRKTKPSFSAIRRHQAL